MSVADSLPQRFSDAMGALLGPDFPAELGVAVSGGGDSMAMLHLAAGWARVYGVAMRVVTIDHGLRPESAAEADLVATEAWGLGLPHTVLNWQPDEITGNLQDAARRARHRLIGDWRGNTAHVLMAHTQDDQAETFLMRLARGSGVDGLAAMAGLVRINGPQMADGWAVVRPLLSVTRAELRHYAAVLHIPFVNDPSNVNPRFDRVRMRALLPALAGVGLTAERLTSTAQAQRRASIALAARASDVALRLTRTVGGGVVFDRDAFARIEAETQLRLLAAALQWVSSAIYRPRLASLEGALDRLLSGGAATLHGAVMQPRGADLWIFREFAAVAGVEI